MYVYIMYMLIRSNFNNGMANFTAYFHLRSNLTAVSQVVFVSLRTTGIPHLEKEVECMTPPGGFFTCSDGSVERDNILAVEKMWLSWSP